MEVDIVCVGFGPATGGFLSTLAPKLPELVRCSRCSATSAPTTYRLRRLRRGDAARGIRSSFPDLDPSQIPMAAPVNAGEGAVPARPARREPARRCRCKLADTMIRAVRTRRPRALELPYARVPAQEGRPGAVARPVQPVGRRAVDDDRGRADLARRCRWRKRWSRTARCAACGCVDQNGEPGMDIRAALTVVGDGPVGAVGRQLDESFGTAQATSTRMGSRA